MTPSNRQKPIKACRLFVLLSLGLTSSTTFISTSSAQEDEPLQEIVVTATRTSVSARESIAAVSIVDGDLVQLGQPQLGLDEALNRVPGLFLQNRFNFAQDLRISSRGFGARASFGIRGIRILVDGIPATLADGQGSVDLIDLSSIQRIEVLRGPASALFGNAAGGVIAIESEVGSDAPYLEARGAVGEFGYDKTQIKGAGNIGNLGYMASIAHVDVDGFREFSQAQNTVINMKGRYRFDGPEGDTVLDLSLSRTDQPEANDPGGINRALADSSPRAARDRNVQFGAGEDLNETRFGTRLTHKNLWRDGDLLTLKAHMGQRDFDGFIPTGDGSISFERTFLGGGVQYESPFTTTTLQHNLVAGIDTEVQDDDRERYQNLSGRRGNLLVQQNEKVDNLGVFLQDTIAMNDIRLVLGVRYDSITYELTDRFLSNGDASAKRTLNYTSPVVGLTWAPNSDFSIYFNRATSFESPTTTELALPTGGFNSALEPQVATNYEVGIRGDLYTSFVPLNYSLAAFTLDIEDELIPIEQADGNDLFFNAGESSRRGIELDATAQLGRSLSVHLAYTWSDFEFEEFVDSNGNDFAGLRTPGTPEHAATLSLDYKSDNGTFATLDAAHVGDIVLNNANTQTSPSQVVLSARAGIVRQYGRWQLSPFIGIQNLTDTRYFANTRTNAFGGRYFEPGPDRSVYGGLTVRYLFKD
ncbi:MAG: TonB-dependent receptor family protein [Gammaproteobacteria bacterium]